MHKINPASLGVLTDYRAYPKPHKIGSVEPTIQRGVSLQRAAKHQADAPLPQSPDLEENIESVSLLNSVRRELYHN